MGLFKQKIHVGHNKCHYCAQPADQGKAWCTAKCVLVAKLSTTFHKYAEPQTEMQNKIGKKKIPNQFMMHARVMINPGRDWMKKYIEPYTQ